MKRILFICLFLFSPYIFAEPLSLAQKRAVSELLDVLPKHIDQEDREWIKVDLEKYQEFSIDADNYNLSLVDKKAILTILEKCTFLKCLSLKGFGLENIPLFIHKCRNLEELDLSGNRMTVFPENIGFLQKLRKLNLSYNNLFYIPRSLKYLNSLEWINLQGNNLKRIPDFMSRLKKLKYLNLGDNQLRTVPSSISRIAHYPTIILSGNEDFCDTGEGNEWGAAELIKKFGRMVRFSTSCYTKILHYQYIAKQLVIREVESRHETWNLKNLTKIKFQFPERSLPIAQAMQWFDDLCKSLNTSSPEEDDYVSYFALSKSSGRSSVKDFNKGNYKLLDRDFFAKILQELHNGWRNLEQDKRAAVFFMLEHAQLQVNTSLRKRVFEALISIERGVNLRKIHMIIHDMLVNEMRIEKDLQSFLPNFIFLLKDKILIEVSSAEYADYYKEKLDDVIGFSFVRSGNRYAGIEGDNCLASESVVLERFFEIFTPEFVAAEMLAYLKKYNQNTADLSSQKIKSFLVKFGVVCCKAES